jgi:acetate kinase
MKNYKKTRAYHRFTEYLDKVKSAKSNKDILEAGFRLINSYGGFRYNHRVISTQEVINKIAEND